MPAVADWLKQNKSNIIGAGLFAPEVVSGLTSDSKLKNMTKAFADIYLWTAKFLAPLRQALVGGWLIGGFNALSRIVKSIIADTGSLAAALQRLQSIQGFTRQFSPLLGGLAAAKQRVSELLVLSARGPFKFEDIASAAKNLEVFTRGAFSSAQATQEIGKAAIATGNGIAETADAVGQFYATLREGRPIDSSVEGLRQMGLISQNVADQLMGMSRGGLSAMEIFNQLTNSLGKTGDGLKQLGDDLATVTAEHEKAKEEMKAAFGAPWTAAEVQRTKNMTAAMQAITPTLAAVSNNLAKVFNGFTTFSSAMTKMVAESSVGQATIKLLGDAIAYLGATLLTIGTVLLPIAIPKFIALFAGIATQAGAANTLVQILQKIGFSATAATPGILGAGRALSILSIAMQTIGTATIIGVAVAGLAALAGMVFNFAKSIEEALDKARDLTDSFRQSNNAIKEQIALVASLADRHEVLAKAIDQSIDAEMQYQELLRKPTLSNIPQILAARKAAVESKQTVTSAAGISAAGLTGPAREALLAEQESSRLTAEQQRFEERMETAPPSERIKELGRRAGVLGGRAAVGRRVVEAGAEMEKGEAEIETRRQLADGRKKQAEKQLADFNKLSHGEQEKRETFSSIFSGGMKKVLEKQLDQATKDVKAGDIASHQFRMQPQFAETPEGKEAKIQELRESETQEGVTEKMRAQIRVRIEQLTIEKNRLEVLKKESESLEEQRHQLLLQRQLEQEAYKLANIRVGTEYRVASLRGTSAQKAQEEFEIRKQEIKSEMAAEIMRHGGPRVQVMAELQGRLNATRDDQRESIRQFETIKSIHDLELQSRIAKREGRSEERVALENEQRFEERFNQFRQEGFSNDEAKQRALQEGAEDIKSRVIPGGPAAVVSSLQRIGGGGGIYAPGGDPTLQTQKQIANLVATSNKYLETIANKGDGVK